MTSKRLASIFAVLLGVTAATAAHAEEGGGPGGKGAIGVGAESLLTGANGAVFIYDTGGVRIDGLLGFDSRGNDNVFLGGRVLFPLHSTQDADFSLGGGLGFVHTDGGGGNDNDDTDFHIEGLAQIRAFVASNVALSAAAGVALIIGDGDDDVLFGGQLVGSVGIAYYFF